jgi:DNA-binding transcriptional ArsR family regulator
MTAFEVLGDPTRRRIVELVAQRDRSAGEIAAAFSISRPGISKHLRILREEGIVTAREAGTRRLYSLEPRALDEVDDWVERCRSFWTNRLDALDTELRRGRR